MPTAQECANNQLITLACDPKGFFYALFGVIGLVTTAGLMAGLTMGLLSIDKLNLEVLEKSGTDTEKLQAQKLAPIVQRHHLLLVTLLLYNAAANEALPVFLTRIVTDTQAVVISITCVLMFGEIIPSAIFTGKRQLAIAAALVPVVQLLILFALPLAWPIAQVLDYCLGHDPSTSRYKRKELKALVSLHHKHQKHPETLPFVNKVPCSYSESAISSSSHDDHAKCSERRDSGTPLLYSMAGTHLHNDEVAIIHGAMDMSSKTVEMIMTPFDKVFMLSVDEKLDDETMVRILASGYSRIPVYKGHKVNVVGLLLVKRLIVLNPAEEKPLKDLMLRRPIVIFPDHSCYSMLNLFQERRSHFALVSRQKDAITACWKDSTDIDPNAVEILGVVTIEDVLEELIMEDITDESDSPHDRRHDTHSLALQQRGVVRAAERFKQLLYHHKE